ncbi:MULTISPECIES: class I lanthipeptide [unclassified Pedobacter]|uniref:class I lanthipeptide n=1 Tax=unclassified Pedobacter TaxID=2628915 RepID=UPI0025D81A7D|nr:class I lanthipeptide [Pedobacter sp. UBA5917]
MKKINLGKKLSLNKETISKLNERQMQFIHGGQAADSNIACTVSYNSCAGGCNGSTKEATLEAAAFGSCCEDSCKKTN